MFHSFAKQHSIRVFCFALGFVGLASWATSRSYLLHGAFVVQAASPTATADLAITKTASPSAGVANGSQMNYTIVVSNNGPDAATDVSVNDPLPAGTTFVSVTPSQGSCAAPAPGNPGTVNCALGTIGSPGSATIALVVTFTGAPGATISNTATVSTTASDMNPANDFATSTTSVAQTGCAPVINTNNSGPGSLSSAIGCANANPGLDAIRFNIPGAGVHTISLTSPLPSITSPVFVDGYSQPGSSVNTLVSGDNAVLAVELNGASAGPAAGFLIQPGGSGSTVRGLIINRFQAQGIALNVGSTGSVVEGDFVGTNATGTSALGNSVGVSVFGAQNSRVGGTTPQARNVISGNLGNGILITNGSANNAVQGNLIGTDASGSAALPNASLNPNAAGIFVTGGAQNNTIGGSSSTARNIISGNKREGVFVSFASRNNILGNYIGTDVAGSASLGNVHRGVMLSSASVNKIVGNLLSGNDGAGLSIENGANSNQVQGNLIGTKADGTSALGNSQFGVLIDRASNNTITTNTIGFNGSSSSNSGGVIVSTYDPGTNSNGISAGNAIRQNSIFSNFGLGIDLYSGGAFGVTPNDLCDGDTGANNFQNSPVLTSLSSSAGNTTIQGALNSSPNTTFTIEVFSNVAADPSGSGEGQTYLGSTSVTTGADCNANFSFAFPDNPGQPVITATATDPAGNTSEFSAWVVTTTTTLASDNNPSTYGQTVTFSATVSSSAGTPTGNVTFKDGATILGTGTLDSSGQATFMTSSLPAGTHSITAVFDGSSNYLSSSSGVLTQIVNQASTSTALASNANPSTYGQTVTFNATVTSAGGTPTGTVTFRDGATVLATVAVDASGQATYMTSSLFLGAHPITATYNGDDNFAGSTSAALIQTVVVPASTESVKVNGGGFITLATGGNGSFGLVGMVSKTDVASGNVEYQDHDAGLNIKSSTITAVVVTGTHARMFGKATVNGAGSFDFVVDVDDLGEPGAGVDKFQIQLSNGYSAGASLSGGNIQVHN